MSRTIHILSKSLSGGGLQDGRCAPASGTSGRAVGPWPCSSYGDYRHLLKPKMLSLSTTFRSTYSICHASSSNPRRNPDFSRQNKYRTSRGRNRQNEERDGFENLEESEMFSSKNGPILTSSNSTRFQATSTPGQREKEIVELFRKVQAQLRERAAMKEGKKPQSPAGKVKETESVDALLSLLRKHTIQQDKGASNTNSIRDRPVLSEQSEGLREEKGRSFLESNSSVNHRDQKDEAPGSSRPRSNFRRRSPVPQFKFQNDSSLSSYTSDVVKKKEHLLVPDSDRLPELKVESEGESDTEAILFDGISEDETSEIFDHDDSDDEVEEESPSELANLAEMKLPELRAIAKSRGVKGYSKMKKKELIDLLTTGKI